MDVLLLKYQHSPSCEQLGSTVCVEHLETNLHDLRQPASLLSTDYLYNLHMLGSILSTSGPAFSKILKRKFSVLSKDAVQITY